MNRDPEEDNAIASNSRLNPPAANLIPDQNGNSLFSSWTSSMSRRRSSLRAAFGETNSALAAITGILIQRPRNPLDELDPAADQQSDIPAWAAAAAADPDSIARGFRFPGAGATADGDSGGSRSSSFGGGPGTAFRRPGAGVVVSPPVAAAGGASGEPATGLARLTSGDLRRAVFLHARDRRTTGGLRLPHFTRQAFVSSFTVGMAAGSLLAIIVKIIRDLTLRLFD